MGVITAPRKSSVFHHIEFLRLGERAMAYDRDLRAGLGPDISAALEEFLRQLIREGRDMPPDEDADSGA